MQTHGVGSFLKPRQGLTPYESYQKINQIGMGTINPSFIYNSGFLSLFDLKNILYSKIIEDFKELCVCYLFYTIAVYIYCIKNKTCRILQWLFAF